MKKFEKFLPLNLKSGEINKIKALSYNIYDQIYYLMYQRRYRVPLSYDLITF